MMTNCFWLQDDITGETDSEDQSNSNSDDADANDDDHNSDSDDGDSDDEEDSDADDDDDDAGLKLKSTLLPQDAGTCASLTLCPSLTELTRMNSHAYGLDLL